VPSPLPFLVFYRPNAVRSGDEPAATHAARTLQLLGKKALPALPALREALAALPVKSELARRAVQAAIGRIAGEESSGTAPRHPAGKAKKR